jgi:hypothetical protein
MAAGSSRSGRALRDLKDWIKPHIVGLLELAGVERAFLKVPVVVEQLRQLARPPQTDTGEGPRVLVLSFRGAWLLHGAWEAVVAEALRRRGAQPTLFICSGGLPETFPGNAPACGIGGIHLSRPACYECTKCGTMVAGALELPSLRLSDLVGSDEMATLTAPLDALGLDELLALKHGDVPIGHFTLTSARWFLCVSDLAADPEGERIVRAFAKSSMILAVAAPRLLDRVKPDVVFLVNGLFFAERIVKTEAERRGLRVVTYERGFIPDTLCFSPGIAGYYDISALWEQVKDQPLKPAQEQRLDEYLSDRRKGLRAPLNYWPTLTEDAERILSDLRLDPARPTAVLFTNITWDSAAQDRDTIFDSMTSWVIETIRLFAQWPETQLVVRVHPAEVRAPGWETRDPMTARLAAAFTSLPANVRVVPPESDLSSYTIMGLSRCGLVYSSTAGLEMAMDGIPVVVGGEVHYAHRGFTIDPASRKDYAVQVRQALESPRSAKVSEQARRYAYAFFFRDFHNFPIVAENAPDFVPTLTARTPDALDPGADATLDRVCQGILQGGEFFGPP